MVIDRLEVRELLGESYGLSPTSVAAFGRGVENTSLAASCGDSRVVVTILRRRSLSSAEAYAGFLVALATHGIASPRVRRTLRGDLVSEIAGAPAIVCDFVEGRHLDPLPEIQLEGLGALLSKLHRSAVPCSLPPTQRLSPDQLAEAARFSDRRFSNWLLSTHRLVAGSFELHATRCATHGDLFSDNIMVLDDGEVVLLDWDDGALDSPLVDLASAILGLCCPWGFDPRRARRLLAGYGPTVFTAGELRAATAHVATVVAFHRYERAQSVETSSKGRSPYEMVSIVESLSASWPPPATRL